MKQLTHRSNYPTDSKTGLTQLLSKSLGSQELARHRAEIAFELEVMAKKADRFGWDRDRGKPAHDRLILDWMNALQDYPLDEVQAACRAAVLSNPNKMPNEGHVVAEIMKARAKAVAHLPKHHVEQPVRHDDATRAERSQSLTELTAHLRAKAEGNQ